MPNNVGDLGKFFVAKGFKKLPKVQKIAQSGHTAHDEESSPNRGIFQPWPGCLQDTDVCRSGMG